MQKLSEFRIKKENIVQKERVKNLALKNNFLFINYENRNRSKFVKEKIFFEMGDFSFNNKLAEKVKNNRIILATNNEVNNANIFSVPIGVTNTSHCKIIGNLDVIVEQFNKEKNYNSKLVYMNFNNPVNCSWYTSRKERAWLLENFKNKNFVSMGKFIRTHEGHRKFIEEIYNHKFVLCPWGNGFDTHRLWMTLYLGSIPIVRNHAVYEQFKHLPILFIDNWDQLNEDFLNQKFEEIHSKTYDFNVLCMDYWSKFIEEL